MREIVLDTETTGTDFKNNDRLIEIGCVELDNHIPTGRHFHCYINPQRAVSEGAFAVHGLSDAFLSDKPVFADVVEDFVAFCADSRLVIHNAPFDVGFLNNEFSRLGASAPPAIVLADVVDTLILARRKHPNAANNLDALCNRYGIDTSRRSKHGALLDAQILAEVYVELLGGKQTSLGLVDLEQVETRQPDFEDTPVLNNEGRKIVRRLSPTELEDHSKLVTSLGQNAIWLNYIEQT